MNSLSKRSSLQRVATFLLTTRSTLSQFTPASFILEPAQRTASTSFTRTVHTQTMSRVSAAQQAVSEPGFVKKMMKKYNLFWFNQSKLKRSGTYLYESIQNHIEYRKFIAEFQLADTFFTWFLITELHIWMLMVRTMAEGEDGKYTRNSMIEAMWADVATRAKILWPDNSSGLRKHVKELSDQFNCAIIGYDEGVNGDDKILAGAIWRRIFQLECNNPEYVEKLVLYVRKQIQYLDSLSGEDIMWQPNIKWLPLPDIK
ncbi:ubiquinol-cytochrome-c reductase complex assembly factor 1 [Athalia rosae]|uniref:ubiquinol-cytochrome-c reductase complex assembly factor 1 n=1 Tax=Athalia rosae TaxID=37344 RepID=UPI002034A140|nr:ubiquinol-cytochrome-c reductase complex assembly factor 1 [Athalia rosae]